MSLLLFVFLTLFYSGHSISSEIKLDSELCKNKYEWVKEVSRTQGGGWIWFPGVGEAESLADAYDIAEGNALEKLVEECIYPHKEIKIHERCDERDGLVYRAYVRLNILDKHCAEARYSKQDTLDLILNKPLEKKHIAYKQYLDRRSRLVSQSATDCSLSNYTSCMDNGRYYYHLNNYQMAWQSFDFGCQKLVQSACFNAGLTKLSLNDQNAALGYFKIECSRGDHQSCFWTGRMLKDTSPELARPYLSKACEAKLAEACHLISVIEMDNKSLDNSKKYAEEGCKLNYAKSCYNVSYILNLQGDKIKSQEYSKKSCELGTAKACHELSIITYDAKKIKESNNYALQACRLGEMKSCHNMGHLLKESGDKVRALSLFQLACEKGFSVSCDAYEKLKKSILVMREIL